MLGAHFPNEYPDKLTDFTHTHTQHSVQYGW